MMSVNFAGMQTAGHHNAVFQLTNHNFPTPSSKLTPRAGHARFRRAPLSTSDSHGPSTSTQSAPPVIFRSTRESNESNYTTSSSSSSRSTTGCSGGNEEATVSNGKRFSGLGIVAPAPAFSSRKPPLPSAHRKRCRSDRPSVSLQTSGSGCHCCKRRKSISKREIKKVPITGSKVASIPADDYSWKKYGDKSIIGSPYPRVYYKCNSGKGCPARKSVEVAMDDSKMLIVTYDGEHSHAPLSSVIVTGLTGSMVQSK
uniref:WRKY transcription factor WRKY51-like n=1 Tax=Erigeron canadensis TaxID=72917 RepID=UPI001CB88FCD|nr:WRKY transcription factor WRKY51-like [Erigeron canadensis]